MANKDPNLYQAPQSYAGYIDDRPDQDWKWLFFSFEGRLTRGRYWIGSLTGLLPFLIVCGVAIGMATGAAEDANQIAAFFTAPGLLIALGIFFLLALWTQLAVGVKRWHDRGKSGLWMLIGLVPYVGSIWSTIELGCLRGTDGPNAYGPDPLD